MNISIKYTSQFEKNFKQLSKKFRSLKSDISQFIEKIEELPNTDLGSGFKKYRVALKSKGKGKSGGVRIITFEVIVAANSKNITLLTMYDKSEQDSISKKQIEEILKNR